MERILSALGGGILIGVATSLLLLCRGRVFGVSGIVAGVVRRQAGDFGWRIALLAGLLVAGLLSQWVHPARVLPGEMFSAPRLIGAGLLVGFGTQLGGGCTSGHGVCGLARMSPRSAVATLSFIFSGICTVWLFSHFGGR